MKTLLKRVVMWSYCRGLICAKTVTRVFEWFGLAEH
ncbi:hypothetical protein C7402_115249 [Paraburkholderia unamae]|uniref:Uncharacterized protein n=1 Tax=Paraburkholderia unamae TaxID=219649 RepID=A0ABX5KFM7_9BURK|nr:hypothetical protein C7402_115249 [Paraburkholderia unamae]